MVENQKKKTISKLLCIVLAALLIMGTIINSLASVLGANGQTCEYHTEHDNSCGYIEAVEASPCTHVHDADCGYVEAASGVEGSPCTHEHDESCGYAEAVEGSPCNHLCAHCDPVTGIASDMGSIAQNSGDLYIGFSLNSDELTAVELGGIRPAEGNDYTSDGSGLVLAESFLSELTAGHYTLKLSFESGDYTVYFSVVANEEKPAPQAAKEPLAGSPQGLKTPAQSVLASFTFDKNTNKAAYDDIAVSYDVGDDTLTGVALLLPDNSEQALSEGYDYKADSTDLAVQKETLAALAPGSYTLRLTFAELGAQDYGITVMDSSLMMAPMNEGEGESGYYIYITTGMEPVQTVSANTWNGTLFFTVNLPKGPTGRYIDVMLPTPLHTRILPQPTPKIPSVTEIAGGVRLTVADSVDEALNLSLSYMVKMEDYFNMGSAAIDDFVANGANSDLLKGNISVTLNGTPLGGVEQMLDQETSPFQILPTGADIASTFDYAASDIQQQFKFTPSYAPDETKNETLSRSNGRYLDCLSILSEKATATFKPSILTSLKVYMPNTTLFSYDESTMANSNNGYARTGPFTDSGGTYYLWTWDGVSTPWTNTEEYQVIEGVFNPAQAATVKIGMANPASITDAQRNVSYASNTVYNWRGLFDSQTAQTTVVNRNRFAIRYYFEPKFDTNQNYNRFESNTIKQEQMVMPGDTVAVASDGSTYLITYFSLITKPNYIESTSTSFKEYISLYDYRNATMTLDFPYELQPVAGSDFLSLERFDKDVTLLWTLSNGATVTQTYAAVDPTSYGTSVTFQVPDIPAGERLTQLRLSTERWQPAKNQCICTIKPGAIHIPEFEEDGVTPVAVDRWVNIDIDFVSDDYTREYPLTAHNIYGDYWNGFGPWYYLTDDIVTSCPEITTTINSKPMNPADTATGQTYWGLTATQTNSYNLSNIRDTVQDPAFFVEGPAALNGDILESQRMLATLYTGKIWISPPMAGMTVTYGVKNKTTGVESVKNYTIPADVPPEGMELNLLEDGEVLWASMLSVLTSDYTCATSYSQDLVSLYFHKDGESTGWNIGDKLFEVEWLDMRHYYDEDGPLDNVGTDISKRIGAEDYWYHYLFYRFSDCECTDTHDGTVVNNQNMGHTGVKSMALRPAYQMLYTMGETSASTPGSVYQNEATTVTINSMLHIKARNDGIMDALCDGSNPQFKSVKIDDSMYIGIGLHEYNTFTIPENKVLKCFLEITKDDIVYTGGTIPVTIKYNGIFREEEEDYIYASYMPKTINTTATGQYITVNGKQYLQVEVALPTVEMTIDGMDPYDNLDGYRDWSGISTSFQVPFFALPSATIGQRTEMFGECYTTSNIDIFQPTIVEDVATTEANGLPYIPLGVYYCADDIYGLVDSDVLDKNALIPLQSPGIEVLQFLFSGVSLIPGANGTYAPDTRWIDVQNHNYDKLEGLTTIVGAHQNLSNYEVVVEIPREGKAIQGKFLTSSSEETVTSEYDMLLNGPIVMQTSSTAGPPTTFQYRVNSAWVNASATTGWTTEDWNDVEAYRIFYDVFPADKICSYKATFTAAEKTTYELQTDYIGGTFQYNTEGGLTTRGSLTFGEYRFEAYQLEGYIWYDVNEDGHMDAAEARAQGINIRIEKRAGSVYLADATTDANGYYQIQLLDMAAARAVITLPTAEGVTYKLTKQSTVSFTDSNADSDFVRSTNQYNLPINPSEGQYEGLGAGIIKLPTISATNVSLTKGQTAAPSTVTINWEKSSTTYFTFEQAADTGIATVEPGSNNSGATVGQVTGVENGTTTAKVSFQNSLGDRVEATYQITVGVSNTSFTLTKTLTTASAEAETFVFLVSGEKTFYLTVTIPAGDVSKSVTVERVLPGAYVITEIDSNWRYAVNGSASRNVTVADDGSTAVAFSNTRDTDAWVSGKAIVNNVME